MSVLMTGPDGVFAANEDAAVNPPSYLLYAKAKSMAEEEVLRAATSTFFAVIVRYLRIDAYDHIHVQSHSAHMCVTQHHKTLEISQVP